MRDNDYTYRRRLNKMGKIRFITLALSICLMVACAPTPTPYISDVDPCAPDILTAIASMGGIPRCDKIPTERPQPVPISIDNQRENNVAEFLNMIIGDPRYDPNSQVLGNYIQYTRIDIEATALHFHISFYPTKNDDGIGLAAELIHAGALISQAGEVGDWELGIIDVNYPADEVSCGVSFYINDKNDLARVNEGAVSIYDVMEVYVCKL
jgi:hypothetical protein